MKWAASVINQSGIVQNGFRLADFRLFSGFVYVQFWSILSAVLGNWQILRLDARNVYTNWRKLGLLPQCNMDRLLFFFHAFPMELSLIHI